MTDRTCTHAIAPQVFPGGVHRVDAKPTTAIHEISNGWDTELDFSPRGVDGMAGFLYHGRRVLASVLTTVRLVEPAGLPVTQVSF